MIKLFQLERTWGIPNLSHFCCKIETYLRMADIEYEVITTLPLFAPKGKLPYVEDGENKVADSSFIVDYLKRTRGDPLDQHLSAGQRAEMLAMQRLFEEHLFWVTMFSRWGDYSVQNWHANKKAIFSVMPPLIRDVAAAYYRHRIKKQIHGHGMGRHSADEIFLLGIKDLDAVSDYLADKPWFMGEKPTSLDACAFGFLIDTLGCPIESPVKAHALSKPNLVQFCQRVMEDYYPEFDTLSLS